MTNRFHSRHHRRVALALIAGMTATLAAASSSASAATQAGETFVGNVNCSGPFTRVQAGSPGNIYAMPSNGVVTQWSTLAGPSSGGQLGLKIMRPLGNNTYLVVGESAVESLTANLSNTFPTRIPVQAGDLVGHFQPAGPAGAVRCADQSAPGTYSISAVSSNVPPGATFTDAPSFGRKLNTSATLEPDCDADGFGDETQDPDTSSCSAKADGTLTIDANKGKVEKGRKVTLSGQYDTPTNEACEPNRTVEVQRRKKSQPDTAFKTFTTVQTDQAGNFADKVKVKKTRIYRAVVAETEACDDETSNSQKVRVQKKKAAQEA